MCVCVYIIYKVYLRGQGQHLFICLNLLIIIENKAMTYFVRHCDFVAGG